MSKFDRSSVLMRAHEATTETRQSTYGPPEINLSCHGELLAIYLKYSSGRHGPGHEASMAQVLAKVARIATGSFHPDNYDDGAAYFACASECGGLVNESLEKEMSGLREEVQHSDSHRSRDLETEVALREASTLLPEGMRNEVPPPPERL